MTLTIHFLSVGHGDCTVVQFPSGRLMVVDINRGPEGPGTSSTSYTDPVQFLTTNYKGREIFRYIQTHPDMDHMSGLRDLVDTVSIANFWDIEHTKKISDDSWAKSPFDQRDWRAYRQLQKREHNVLHNLADAKGEFWSDDHMTVLGPTAEMIEVCNEVHESWNNASYVLRIEHAGWSIILPGDAEEPEWESLIDTHGKAALKCDILKAAHHGRQTGFHQEAVAAMSPQLVICSVGEQPDTDATAVYEETRAQVYSTYEHGTITMVIEDDGRIKVSDAGGQVLTKSN
ncbi:MAG: ComEC/Rec2 family competence protein [Candidatus Dormibacteria bacterium]